MNINDINWTSILIGLSLFLFGIDYMGEGLKNLSAHKLTLLIRTSTSHPFKGILTGAGITALIQSSSATTAITVSLIRGNMMTFDQAIGIIMGANIGTTITAFIVGLDISAYAVYFIIIGVMMAFIIKKKLLAQIVFGIGCLFYGLELMSSQLQLIAEIPELSELMKQTINPFLALVIGLLATCAIQSSSAFIAIVQKLYDMHAITLLAAIPFLMGSNIGTTITAILAAIGGNHHVKQAAFFHVIFNVCGTVVFMFLLDPFYHLLISLPFLMALSPAMLLAVIHGFFNIMTTLMLYPFIRQISRFIKKMFPAQDH